MLQLQRLHVHGHRVRRDPGSDGRGGSPIKAPVAGISIGLVAGEDGRFVTLTDIQGLEDHLGDMDFKVAGTREGISAIQLDIKVKSISFEIIDEALQRAKAARGQILERIHQTISAVREDLSPFAPRMQTIHIPVDKIGMVIGPGRQDDTVHRRGDQGNDRHPG